VKIDMTRYIEKMVDEFPIKLKSTDLASTPAADNLFDAGTGKKLEKDRKEIFHTWVAKGLFVAKRARPDIHPTIASS
jgi:hypothetical protein